MSIQLNKLVQYMSETSVANGQRSYVSKNKRKTRLISCFKKIIVFHCTLQKDTSVILILHTYG